MRCMELTWSVIFVVQASNFRLSFNLDLLRLNLDIAAAGSMSDIVHTADFGLDTSHAQPERQTIIELIELEVELSQTR